MSKTDKMTPTRLVYSGSWTCKSLKWPVLVLLFFFQKAYSKCQENKTTPSTLEIEDVGHYMDLICQVEKQCKVSWQKDDEPLILTDDGRIFCESTKCNCRTLKFRSLVSEDSGNYTCLGVEGCEGEEYLPQHIELRVDEYIKPIGAVLVQSSECQDRTAHPGEQVTFCCVCKVGQVTGSTYAYWLMGNKHMESYTDEAAQDAVSHNPREELASCITLNVDKTSEGNYTVECSTPYGSDTQTLQLKVKFRWWIAVIIGIMLFILVIVLAGFICRRNWIEIRLLCKDKFGTQEKNDGNLYDAYISYYWSDSESSHNPDRMYALDLKQRLTELGYTVCLAETDFLPGNETSEEIVESLKRSRRYIILLSPQFLTYRYMSLETEQCLDIIKQHKKQVIPIFIRDIPPNVIMSHVALEHIVSTHPRLNWQIFEDSRSMEAPMRTLSMENGNAIELENCVSVRTAPKLEKADVRVWKTLRLQMPPVPRHHSSEPTEELLASTETEGLIRN